ncbi:MAG: SpoIIE family protein phosphatase, partial [Anaerotignum sp.]
MQSYGPVSYDRKISRKYAGVALERGGFVQVGYDALNFQKDIASIVSGLTQNRHIGENGYLIIADVNWNIVSDRQGSTRKKLGMTGLSLGQEKIEEGEVFSAEIRGVPSYCIYTKTEGYYIIGVLPQSEAFFLRDVSVFLTVFMEIVIFAAQFILVYFLIKSLIVDNIRKINNSLGKITGGDLSVTVDVRTNEEFASLSDDINATVVTLKQYIDEAAARVDQELEYAKTIQLSAMPRVFPPYPEHKEFEIYASMRAAKEVGGDFYDFYLLGEDKLAFLIADVSGKGIPAAMFMMTAKTLIKSLTESGLEIDEVFSAANDQLCENNDAGMFVTAWMGIIDLKTGLVSYANGGHNPPVVKRGEEGFTFLETDGGFVLAAMEGFPYSKGELQLMPG